MSETKASSDPLWHVGCLEGYAACLVAMSDADHPMVHGDQALALLRDMAKDKDLEKAGQMTSSTWTALAEGKRGQGRLVSGSMHKHQHSNCWWP